MTVTDESGKLKGLTAERLSRGVSDKKFVNGEMILEVKDLTVNFWVNDDWFTAAENVSYTLRAGEVLAIVG